VLLLLVLLVLYLVLRQARQGIGGQEVLSQGKRSSLLAVHLRGPPVKAPRAATTAATTSS
jgi:hypothetical protein